MMEFEAQIQTMQQVSQIVNRTGQLVQDVRISSKNYRYIVSAKSIMGILSLDLGKPVLFKLDEPDEAYKDDILRIVNS